MNGYRRLLAALLLIVAACGESGPTGSAGEPTGSAGQPTAWDQAITAHSDIAEAALRLAGGNEGYLIEQYNKEHDAWSSVDDCDTLYHAWLDAWDLLQQTSREALDAFEESGGDVGGDQFRDRQIEYLARMTAITVIRTDSGCTGLDATNTTSGGDAEMGSATTLVLDSEEQFVLSLREVPEEVKNFIDVRTDEELLELGFMVCSSFDDEVGSVTDITDVVQDELDAGPENISLAVHVVMVSVDLLCPVHWETLTDLETDGP